MDKVINMIIKYDNTGPHQKVWYEDSSDSAMKDAKSHAELFKRSRNKTIENFITIANAWKKFIS